MTNYSLSLTIMDSYLRFLFLGIISTASVATLVAATSSDHPWETPPGWTETKGGDGGKVYRVTTLAARGPGSLAEALAADDPRVIEFAVGGTIDLQGNSLKLDRPRVTIAGETAPAPGITLINGGINVGTNDVIIRHICVRPGAGQHAKGSGWEMDGLSTGNGAHDVIIDHCSFTWATDENLSASGPRFEGATPDEWRENTSHRITLSNCIIGEGLNFSSHAKGPHSKGTLIHDNASDIALIGNLYISNEDRNPLFKAGVRAIAVNNLIYNPGERVMQFGYVPAQWNGRELQRTLLSLAGNVVRMGPSSASEMAFFEIWPNYGPCDFYLHDNLMFDATGQPLPVTVGARDRARLRAGFSGLMPGGSGYDYRLVPAILPAEMRQVSAPPLWPPRLKALPASETQASVLAQAGAHPWDRDPVDRRLIEDVTTDKGKIINSASDVKTSRKN